VPKLGRKNNHPSHHNFQPIRNMIPIGQQIYSDEKGEFMIIMIKEGYWTCPACGTKNPDYNEYCSNSNCPLSW
jgi:uncharacterized GH25 family protein